MPHILSDTTVLSNFSQVRRPDLLRKAFPGLASPRAVLVELKRGENLKRIPVCDWSWLEVLDPSGAERSRATELERILQAGEAVCLAMAEARGALFLTDDFSARRLAATLRVEVSGTLGALVRLRQRELISLQEGDRLLTEMIACGYRSPVRSIREL